MKMKKFSRVGEAERYEQKKVNELAQVLNKIYTTTNGPQGILGVKTLRDPKVIESSIFY